MSNPSGFPLPRGGPPSQRCPKPGSRWMTNLNPPDMSEPIIQHTGSCDLSSLAPLISERSRGCHTGELIIGICRKYFEDELVRGPFGRSGT